MSVHEPRNLGHLERACPVRTAIDVIAGRWKPSILQHLYAAPRRYADLQSSIPAISAQALSLQLGQLAADGVIEKSDGDPALWRLTKRGSELAEVMEGLERWGSAYLDWRAR